jgi:aspartyl-tRNA(Asn)/glutamyl-tRNA(Gln) amidotransferase subunit A
MTTTALDAALMLQVIAGYDPQDPGSINLPIPDYAGNIAASTSLLRLGVARGYFYDELHPDVQAAMEASLSVLKKLTGTQRDIPPLASDGTYSTVANTALTILMAESYEFHREYISKNPELYQQATAKRIRDGANVTISAYMQSRRQLDQMRHFVTQVFDSVDLVITPTTRIPPFPIADLTDSDTARLKEVLMLHNTRPFNVLALPTISVPCGFTAQGLPVGMQISGPPGAEATVLRLAHAYEQATEWHKRKPNLG